MNIVLFFISPNRDVLPAQYLPAARINPLFILK
ncbi:hypothetical protein Pvag_pPag20063 (plasmid) [Pantoea vagans C9-1]|nr:hypothetical protein Pvag_pPag20063 [Pantoea vagans C9-1]